MSNQAGMRDTKPLRILILGGTGFIGPCYVLAAVERGHRVSIFNRGKRKFSVPENVESLLGDRNADLESLKGREWDAVIDLAAFVPSWVRRLGEALKDRVKHYTFISTVAAYDVPVGSERLSEDSRLRVYGGDQDPYLLPVPRDAHEYGAFKALCEREAEAQFPRRTLILRPGQIVGPGEPGGHLTYWPIRMAKGGEALVAGDPWISAQFIDARDLAEWSIRMIEQETTGIYNAVGPAAPINLGEMVEAACAAAPLPTKPVWVPSSWLVAQKGGELYGSPLFWTYDAEWSWSLRGVSIQRALARGLTFRPLSVTLADAWDFYRKQPEPLQAELKVSKTNEKGVVEKLTIPWAVYLQKEKDTLASWRAAREQQPGWNV